jgi:hypothetical protein
MDMIEASRVVVLASPNVRAHGLILRRINPALDLPDAGRNRPPATTLEARDRGLIRYDRNVADSGILATWMEAVAGAASKAGCRV